MSGTATTLHAIVFPNLDVPGPEELCLRLDGGAWAELAARTVRLPAGGVLSTDTFHSGFSVGAWKRLADVGALRLRLEGSGELQWRLGLHRPDQASLWLDDGRVAFDGDGDAAEGAGGTFVRTVDAWPRLADGMLFVHLRALRPSTLRGAAFETPAAAPNDVRLGLVVTHFERQAQVRPAIRRIAGSLLARPALGGRITLTVVDNSRNLGLEPLAGVDVIPNRNLGGTGGFVRGLLALVDGGRATHALFMDDDASCEVESIARTFALLSFARDPDLAVAGALLREAAPWELLEKGARFDGRVVPLHAGLDVRRVDDCLRAERGRETPDYGAWWFFAFPIARVRRYPFPFFVRGDDVAFGLANRFPIATLNGVACLGEDFSAKHGPLTAYLDARYHLVLALLAPEGAAARVGWVASRLFAKALSAYQYASARAVTLAVRHVLAGPAFFRDHLDLASVRREIAAWGAEEKLGPVDLAGLALRGGRRPGREPAWRRLARLVTLQGFLLPDALLRDRTTVHPKDFHGRASAVFRYRSVLYWHEASGTGFLARHDRRRFAAELGAFAREAGRLLRRLPALRRRYAEGAEALTSEAFWRGVYERERMAPPTPPAAAAPAAAATSAAPSVPVG